MRTESQQQPLPWDPWVCVCGGGIVHLLLLAPDCMIAYRMRNRIRLSRYMLRHEPSRVTGRLFVFRPVGGRPVGIVRGDAWCALCRRARAGLRLSIITYGPILALTAARALTSRRLTRWPSHDAVGTRRPPWSRHGTTQRARTREAEMKTRLTGVNCGLYRPTVGTRVLK